MTEVTPSSYWIASNALYITLNANGDPDYIVGNATSGAQILVYMKGIDGLEYDAGHNYRRWPLSLSPTYFGTRTAKYVYVAVPRPGNPVGIATVVFPSEHIDIYGKNEQEEQIGSEDFYYVFLQGIISATNAGSTEPRTWQQAVETGTLSSDEALDAGGDNTWWKISTVDDTVHFLKEIVMDAKSFFQNFRLNGHEFVSEAKPGVTPLDSENTIVTPLFGNRHYISKDHDDETQGEIGFLKGLWIKAKNLFGIGETGDASFRNLHLAENADIDGVLRSWAGVFANLLQSSNWTGDGHFDTGFRLMKDAAGVTSMVVDNLFVRMKAIFTELEIRKISYAGGNIIFSHAGGRIVALAGVAYIKGEARVIGHTIYLDDAEVVGHKIILPDGAGEFAYRCYMLADDGTTRTQNWWQVDDQARCQTFNIQAGTYQNVSNSFYWRRVVGTGTEVLSDGKTYDYVDLSATDCFTGTSIDGIDVSGFESVPQTGDQLVQMGNRTDASRQGFVTIEVRGENAPAFKVYKNVNSYSLDNKRKICLSPSLTDLKVQKLTIETEYDAKRVPMERGNWADIPDHKCYYYDLVQHNGATWLCTYPESGIGGVLFTTEEPSEGATYWQVYAEKGEQGASTTVKGEAVAHFATWESLIAAIQTGVFTPTEGDYILLDSSDGYEEGEDRPSVVEFVNGPDHTWDIQFPSLLEGWIINGYLWIAQETEWYNNGKWQGDDAINIMLTPESIILNQDLQTKAIDLTQAYSDVTVVKGDEILSNFVVTIGTGADAPVHCNASVSGNRVRITSILSSGGVYYDNGSVTVKITYNGNTYTKVFKFYANLLGTWKETVEADTKTAVAEMKYYVYDKDGRVIAEQNIGEYIQSSSINQSTIASTVGGMAGNGGNILAGSELFPVDTKLEHVSTQADGVIEYPQGSSPAIYSAVQLVAGKTYILQIKSDGTLATAHDGSGGTQVGKYTVWLRINGTLDGEPYNGHCFTSANLTGTLDDGALWWRFECRLTGIYWLRTNTYSDGTTPVTVHFWDMMLEQSTIPSGWSAPSSRVLSQIKQTASQIELSITNKLGETGININGNTREIDLIAGKVNFKNSDGTTNPKIAIDPATGTLHAVDGVFSGTVEADKGHIGGFDLSEGQQTSPNKALVLDGAKGEVRLQQSDGDNEQEVTNLNAHIYEGFDDILGNGDGTVTVTNPTNTKEIEDATGGVNEEYNWQIGELTTTLRTRVTVKFGAQVFADSVTGWESVSIFEIQYERYADSTKADLLEEGVMMQMVAMNNRGVGTSQASAIKILEEDSYYVFKTRIGLHCEANPQRTEPTGTPSLYVKYDILDITYTQDFYRAELFGNGLVYGTSNTNYFGVMQRNNGMLVESSVPSFEDGSKVHGFHFSTLGFMVIRQGVSGMVFPTIWVGRLTWQAGTLSLENLFSWDKTALTAQGLDGLTEHGLTFYERVMINIPLAWQALNIGGATCIFNVQNRNGDDTTINTSNGYAYIGNRPTLTTGANFFELYDSSIRRFWQSNWSGEDTWRNAVKHDLLIEIRFVGNHSFRPS